MYKAPPSAQMHGSDTRASLGSPPFLGTHGQSVKSSPLSPPGPTSCEKSRARALLSSWKQAGSQGKPSPKDLFIPTCLEVSL